MTGARGRLFSKSANRNANRAWRPVSAYRKVQIYHSNLERTSLFGAVTHMVPSPELSAISAAWHWCQNLVHSRPFHRLEPPTRHVRNDLKKSSKPNGSFSLKLSSVVELDDEIGTRLQGRLSSSASAFRFSELVLAM